MNKGFNFSTTATSCFDFFKAKFASHNGTFHTSFHRKIYTATISNSHLSAGVQGQIRHNLSSQTNYTQILHDDTINANIVQEQQIACQILHFAIINESIYSNINSYAMHMSEVNSFRHFFPIEVASILACAKSFTTHINCISTCVNCCFQSFPATSRSK